jgi:PhzF family phenazine biosynthesis protein
MSAALFIVDAFTDRPFRGNPAAVCLLPEPAHETWMQELAKEMNLSETAFLWREGDRYRLRWFTPATEVALCGHATLASAHILWETRRLPAKETIRFQTLSGELTAAPRASKIVFNSPATPVAHAPVPIGLSEALAAAPP